MQRGCQLTASVPADQRGASDTRARHGPRRRAARPRTGNWSGGEILLVLWLRSQQAKEAGLAPWPFALQQADGCRGAREHPLGVTSGCPFVGGGGTDPEALPGPTGALGRCSPQAALCRPSAQPRALLLFLLRKRFKRCSVSPFARARPLCQRRGWSTGPPTLPMVHGLPRPEILPGSAGKHSPKSLAMTPQG